MTEKETINVNNIQVDYLPIIYKIPSSKTNIFDYNENPQFSQNIDYPKFSLGFHHFIHQSKKNFGDVSKEFVDKKKVYYIINKFEHRVDDYDADISNITKAYFDIEPKPNVLSRAFYKLWEIFFMFDIIDLNETNFVSAHLAEGPGSFIQATMFYRDKFAKKGTSKNDKYYAVTLHAEDIQKHVPKLEENFIQYYSKEKPPRFIMHKTYPLNEARQSKIKDNGDLTNPKTIKLFGGNFNNQKANFVTADGGFEWGNENIQEQEAFKLILAQIITALEIQAKGGSFVCKIYESFTNTTSKLLSILNSFYDNIYITKPLMSRASNSEKYIVCLGFKDHKTKNNDIGKLHNILNQMNTNKNLVDIFPEFIISDELKAALIKINVEIENKQFKNINEMIVFIKNQNYRGDEYINRRKMQIDASKYWLDTHFPNTTDFNKSKNNMMKLTEKIITENIKNVENIQKKLDF